MNNYKISAMGVFSTLTLLNKKKEESLNAGLTLSRRPQDQEEKIEGEEQRRRIGKTREDVFRQVQAWLDATYVAYETEMNTRRNSQY